MKKRILAALLTLAMLFSMVPVSASAEGQNNAPATAEESVLTEESVSTETEPSEMSPEESAPAETLPVETSPDESDPEESLPDQADSEEASSTHTITYYEGDTVLAAKKVADGSVPAEIPAVDSRGIAIRTWYIGEEVYTSEEAGSRAVTKDESRILWATPLLNSDEHTCYIDGMGEGLFGPDATLTRAQAATMLYQLLESREAGPFCRSFSDVSDSAWYAKYVNLLASLNLVSGYEDGTFHPDSPITRAEFVTILSNLFPVKEGESSFPDVSENHWAYRRIGMAAAYGWVSGYPDGTFHPDGNITRAEAVTILNQSLHRSARAEATKEMIEQSGIRRFLDVNPADWFYYQVLEASTIHTYEMRDEGEVWTGYTYSSCGYSTGVHTIRGTQYYVDSNQQFAPYFIGLQEKDGKLVYVQADGSLLENGTVGYLTFDETGAYTSRDATLDELVDAALAACITPGASREIQLREAYVYIRDNYTYLARAHQERGSTSWTVESATFFFQNGKGNCYCFAGAFLYMARRLGFQAYPISGGVGSNNADHAWVMIDWPDGQTYLFDVELEYAYRYRYTGSRRDPNMDIYKKLPSQYPFTYYFP